MANVTIDDQHLKNIADTIRKKTSPFRLVWEDVGVEEPKPQYYFKPTGNSFDWQQNIFLSNPTTWPSNKGYKYTIEGASYITVKYAVKFNYASSSVSFYINSSSTKIVQNSTSLYVGEKTYTGNTVTLYITGGSFQSTSSGGCYCELIGLDADKQPLETQIVIKQQAVMKNNTLKPREMNDAISNAISNSESWEFANCKIKHTYPAHIYISYPYYLEPNQTLTVTLKWKAGRTSNDSTSGIISYHIFNYTPNNTTSLDEKKYYLHTIPDPFNSISASSNVEKICGYKSVTVKNIIGASIPYELLSSGIYQFTYTITYKNTTSEAKIICIAPITVESASDISAYIDDLHIEDVVITE